MKSIRLLFYGPQEESELMIKQVKKLWNRHIEKIDISAVMSKYIGETEKNIRKLFDRAESKNWILFIDEADALFGKRTSVNDAHDKYANQETNYLLERIENHNDITILGSRKKLRKNHPLLKFVHLVITMPAPDDPEKK